LHEHVSSYGQEQDRGGHLGQETAVEGLKIAQNLKKNVHPFLRSLVSGGLWQACLVLKFGWL